MLAARRVIALAASLVGTLALGTARPAAADALQSALDQPMVEVSHTVDVAVKDGVATYRVQRVFANRGTVADEARLTIDLPYGGVATGLRIRARARWFSGALMEAAQAAAQYQERTGPGGGKPKDPALLYWLGSRRLGLHVFPVRPGATSTVEYTLTVPTRYAGGAVVLSYPRLAADAANLATPVLTVRPAWGDATTWVAIDGDRVATGTPIVLAPLPPLPAWMEAIDASPAHGYASSAITFADDVRARKPFTSASVYLDLGHASATDLKIELLTPAGTSIDVYDGRAPHRAFAGRDLHGVLDVTLPARTTGVGTWRLVITDRVVRNTGTLRGWRLSMGSGADRLSGDADDWVFVPDRPVKPLDRDATTIELAPPPVAEVTARLGRVVASSASAFSRVEVDVAPELRPLPRRPQVVFVVDASHSMGPAGIDGQLRLIRAYLGHVPDAEVELVLYRRTATRLFGGFLGVNALDARLAAAQAAGALAPGNGSALDDGARAAAAAIITRKGPRRIVLLSDHLLRPRWTNALALTALATTPADVVVHLIVADVRGVYSTHLNRDDTDPLAAIPRAHRGIFAGIAVRPDAPGDDLPARVLGLVRPVQIDGFAINGLDTSRNRYFDSPPLALHEGSSLRVLVANKAPPTVVELTGMIWGDRFRKTVAVDAGFSRAAAGWVFSLDDHHDLSPSEQRTLATMGRAVSPVTSYLATGPGERPTAPDLDRDDTMVERYGGRFGTRGSGTGETSTRTAGLMALVADGARACVAKHPSAEGWSVDVEVDTTYDEIVDVHVTAGAGLAIAPCLTEAVWAARLTSAFDVKRGTATLSFR